ncbi:hypothetical protein AB0J38_11730 [Streptomyces sp. NPDC050095]|uniref:hypothetical protein n=1 Tax=unclassified Streptomyces TaxID=2593676 RepID=UPI00342CFB7B
MRHHRHSVRRPATLRTHTASCSPLQVLEQVFLALARDAVPLTLPAALVCGPEVEGDWPVDQIRARLAHPSTRPELREQTWAEVVRRAQSLGEPWSVVALAMALPALHRMLARLPRPAHLERAEVEQEALAALTGVLRDLDGQGARPDLEMFRAADRAVHRLVYSARRRVAVEVDDSAVQLGRVNPLAPTAPPHAGLGDVVDEHAVLARAVQARVVDVAEARLIARTRLGGERMQVLADERGVGVRQLYRHRSAAEAHLAAYLQRQLADQ